MSLKRSCIHWLGILVVFLWGSLSLGMGKELDPFEREALQVQAEAGDPESQTELAKWYCREGSSEEELKLALSWFQKAADQGFPGGEFGIGTLYFFGMGVKQDFTKAVEWIYRAAEKDDALAQCTLGRIYFDGMGVTQNFIEAYKWFELSARHDSLLAIRCREITASRMTPQEVEMASQMASRFSFKPRVLKLALNSHTTVH